MFSKYSVKKPYTVLVGVILVIVLGIVSLSKMTTDLLPDMSFQYALIITTDVGASPEEVETDVTAPVESAMATTSNIKNVSSMSYNSYSIVTCEYEQNANMDSVVIEIQQELDQLSASWDDSIGSPVIMQINPDMLPIVMAAVDVKGMDSSQITDYVENELIPSIESIEGVASVSATGELKESVQVTLNQDKIDALNEKIQSAIEAKFSDAESQMDSATSQIESGQNAISSAKDQLSDGIDSINEKKTELLQTQTDLENQLAELKTQRDLLNTVKSGIDSFVYKNADAASGEFSDSYSQLVNAENGIAQLDQAIEQMKSLGLDDSSSQVQELAAQKAAAQSAIDTANAQLASQFGQLSTMGITITTYKDLPAASASLSGTIAQVNAGISAIETGLSQIEEGKLSLSDALDTINSQAALGAIDIGQQSAQLAIAADSLEDAKSQLDEKKDSALDQADLNTVLSMDTLSSILTAQNFSMPAGYVNAEDGTQYIVKIGDTVDSIDDLKNLVLMDMGLDGVDAIRVSDVADVEIVDNSGESYAVVNGSPGIILSLEKQTGYSTGDVTDRVLDKFDALEAENENLNISVLMNQGVYIDLVVDSVVQNMIVGAILAVIVLILFLKDIKPTIVIACSIPLSVIAAVVIMYFTGITLNVISMSGLVLGIGMLVDNSIVVIENIYRLRGEGYSIKEAAIEGASQVSGAIVASTLTTVSVYAPIIFTEGITRQLFVDLALTIAFTLIASLVVALTFVPAMACGVLKKTKEIKHPWFDAMKNAYGKFLELCLRFKPLVFIAAIALLIVSAWGCISKGMTFMDMDMETKQLSVTIAAKEDEKLDFDELTALSDEVMDRISDIDGIETIGATAGGSSTMSLMSSSTDSVSMYIILDEDSDVSSSEVADQIAEKTKDMDCDISTDTSSMDMTSYFGSGISVKIKGSDLDKLQDIAADVAQILEDTEGVIDIDDGLNDTTAELKITVDKEEAAKYGYTVAQVFQLVYADMSSNQSATTISTDIKKYEVYLQTEDQSELTVEDIKALTFTHVNDDGEEEEIPLTRICDIEETNTLSTIHRDSQTRYITVSGGIDENHNVTLVSNKIQKSLDKLDIPEGYSVEMVGEDETINDAMSQMGLMLVLAVIFIYLIMVAQFQSLASPFIIMFSIPLAFTGGFLGLIITGQELGAISMLGFIMLAGLIVNNGIVLIDYINQARKAGMSKHDAIVDAGKTRIRPILMTALTTILAMSTSAIGMGQGSEMMRPMAITIIGGLIYGTVLTLIVIPCIYDAFNREKDMREDS